ncbi:MAG: hypothetical protein J6386_01630 [Candidatus Synoicihabitans palmerolidicus]|nr:hypothetical protein [Candidatus Synoicihabitans palmerolidicus]
MHPKLLTSFAGRFILSLVGATLLASMVHAETKASPRGGRLLPLESTAVECFITLDHHAELTFYDATDQPVRAGLNEVKLIAAPTSGRTPIALTTTAHGFRSFSALPPRDALSYSRADPSHR